MCCADCKRCLYALKLKALVVREYSRRPVLVPNTPRTHLHEDSTGERNTHVGGLCSTKNVELNYVRNQQSLVVECACLFGLNTARL